MSDPNFSLKWDSYHESVSSAFGMLREQNELTDVELFCESESLHVHGLVLSACSPYFRNIIKKRSGTHGRLAIVLRDTRMADIRALVQFMYSGGVNVLHSQLNSLLATARALQVSGLCGDGANTKKEDFSASYSPHQRMGTVSSADSPTVTATKPSYPVPRTSSTAAVGGSSNVSCFTAARSRASCTASSTPHQHTEDNLLPDEVKVKTEPEEVDCKPTPEQLMLGSQNQTDQVHQTMMGADSAGFHQMGAHDQADFGQSIMSAESADFQHPVLQNDSMEHDAMPSMDGTEGVSTFSSNVPSPGTAPINNAGVFTCVVCEKQYTNRISLVHHMKSHQGKTTCPLCMHVFSMVANLRSHLRTRHGMTQQQVRRLVPTRLKNSPLGFSGWLPAPDFNPHQPQTHTN